MDTRGQDDAEHKKRFHGVRIAYSGGGTGTAAAENDHIDQGYGGSSLPTKNTDQLMAQSNVFLAHQVPCVSGVCFPDTI